MTRTSQREDMRRYFLFAPPPYPRDGTTSNNSPPRARRAGLVQGIARGDGNGSNWTIHYYPILIRERAEPPNIVQKLQSNFKFQRQRPWDKHLSCHNLSLSNRMLQPSSTKWSTQFFHKYNVCEILSFRTNDLLDLCTFCDNQRLSLLIIISHLFCHCSQSKQFWIELELYWCLISNQRIRLTPLLRKCVFCFWNFDGKCLTLLQLLNNFIIIGELYLWDSKCKWILSNFYGFRRKIIAKYEIEKNNQQQIFFKRK